MSASVLNDILKSHCSIGKVLPEVASNINLELPVIKEFPDSRFLLLLENKDFIIELRVYIKNTISANRFVMDSISVCIHILKKQK